MYLRDQHIINISSKCAYKTLTYDNSLSLFLSFHRLYHAMKYHHLTYKMMMMNKMMTMMMMIMMMMIMMMTMTMMTMVIYAYLINRILFHCIYDDERTNCINNKLLHLIIITSYNIIYHPEASHLISSNGISSHSLMYVYASLYGVIQLNFVDISVYNSNCMYVCVCMYVCMYVFMRH